MSRRTYPPGFTLLEVLLTMTVALLLIYAAVAGFSRVIDASAIDNGAQLVRDCLAEARQDAVTQNMTVEVRLYPVASGSGYGTLQLHGHNADGTTPAVALPVILPTDAVIDATAAHSSLVTGTQKPAPDPSDSRLTPQTRCFHFLPNGSTDLASTSQWTLTVRPFSQADPNHFPANWACVTLDPVTGRAQIYRP